MKAQVLGCDPQPMTVDGADVDTCVLSIAVAPTGPAGAVWRLPDGRLAVLTVADVAEGAEGAALDAIAGRLAVDAPTPVFADDMRDLGIDAGLQAAATN